MARALILPGSDIESALERLLGRDVKPAELAHVGMRTKLGQAGLDHFMDLPQQWPPSLAVWIVVSCSASCARRPPFAFQVRELATRVKAVKTVGERNPCVAAVEVKK